MNTFWCCFHLAVWRKKFRKYFFGVESSGRGGKCYKLNFNMIIFMSFKPHLDVLLKYRDEIQISYVDILKNIFYIYDNHMSMICQKIVELFSSSTPLRVEHSEKKVCLISKMGKIKTLKIFRKAFSFCFALKCHGETRVIHHDAVWFSTLKKKLHFSSSRCLCFF